MLQKRAKAVSEAKKLTPVPESKALLPLVFRAFFCPDALYYSFSTLQALPWQGTMQTVCQTDEPGAECSKWFSHGHQNIGVVENEGATKLHDGGSQSLKKLAFKRLL